MMGIQSQENGLLVGPYRRHKVDDEQIVGVQEEADASETLAERKT